jgi:hypothetical protein
MQQLSFEERCSKIKGPSTFRSNLSISAMVIMINAHVGRESLKRIGCAAHAEK